MVAAGQEIAGYRIERPLGRGGMGAVFEATQLSLGRTVALKLLDPHLGGDDGFRERFRREARMQARMEHPNIVPVYEAGEAPEGLYISMRLIRGSNLRGLIKSGELEPGRAIALLRQVADALDGAHEEGLLHRDVKPQNILVGARDHAFLADFGITKSQDATSMTLTGGFLGTLAYAAPEQIHGHAVAASDVYALACVAYEALTGSIPFAGLPEPAMIFAHMSEAPAPASARNPKLPAAVDAVLARGLAKEPAQRPPSATAFMSELAAAVAAMDPRAVAPAVLDDVPTRPVAPPPTAPTPATVPVETPVTPATAEDRPRRLHPAALLGALVAAGAGIGALAGGLLGDGDPPATGTARLASGAFAVAVPSTWTGEPLPAVASELGLAKAVARRNPAGGLVVLGTTDEASPSLIAGQSKPGAPVDLGDLEALRSVVDDATVFAAPAREAVATIACVGLSTGDCEAVAGTLSGGTGERVGPDPAYGEALRAALAKMRTAVSRQLAGYAKAKTSEGQRSIALRTAGAYAGAAKALGRLSAPRRAARAHRDLRTALRAHEAAYERLAGAARREDRGDGEAAERAIAAARRDAAAALEQLSELGYREDRAR